MQVVRGKVPKRCLWDACKALTLGMTLLIIGTGVAVVGYFSDQLATAPDAPGDWNVTNRNGTTTTHLNNLSYVGPIIMGFGGFIIVIACVMTFEARDSAAKVAPSKLKGSQDTSLTEENVENLERTIRTFQRMDSRRSLKAQTPARAAKGKAQPSGGGVERPSAPPGKKPFSGALMQVMQLSRNLADRRPPQQSHRRGRRLNDGGLNKSPSAPDLWGAIPDALVDELLAAGRGGPAPPDRKHGDPFRPLEGGFGRASPSPREEPGAVGGAKSKRGTLLPEEKKILARRREFLPDLTHGHEGVLSEGQLLGGVAGVTSEIHPPMVWPPAEVASNASGVPGSRGMARRKMVAGKGGSGGDGSISPDGLKAWRSSNPSDPATLAEKRETTVPSSMLPRFTRLKLQTLSMDNPFSDICEFYTPMCFKPMPQHNKNMQEFVSPLPMKSSRRLGKGITDLDALARKPSPRHDRGTTGSDTPLPIEPSPKLSKAFSQSSAPPAAKSSPRHADDICQFETLPIEPPRQQSKDSDSDPDDSGSQASMALDLHECQVTIKVKDETASKRSETGRRHQLQRQKPVEEESPSALRKYPGLAWAVHPPKQGMTDVGTMKSPNLRSPCHHCCSEPGKISASNPRGDFRSRSFSKASTHPNPFEDGGASRIFCIDDHRRPANCTCDSIRSLERENFRWRHRSSSSVSPPRPSRQRSSKSLLCTDPRNDAGQKTSGSLEGSSSGEGQTAPGLRLASQRRSLSLPPTGLAPV